MEEFGHPLLPAHKYITVSERRDETQSLLTRVKGTTLSFIGGSLGCNGKPVICCRE